jgi:hypothetical protein
MSKILIIPTEGIQKFCKSSDDLKFFFTRFPFESVIETALTLENHRDYSAALWDEIEAKLTEDEIEMLNLENVDTILELITEIFYEELRSVSTDFDITYTVITWLPDCVCLMPNDLNLKLKNVVTQVPHNYPASEF